MNSKWITKAAAFAIVGGLTWVTPAFARDVKAVESHAVKKVEKLDFDDVVVQSLTRTPTNMDTLGIINQRRRSTSIYEKKGNFREGVSPSLGELGDIL